ncbi:hypothetical protein HPB47_007882, partial [Ixodes persulcatus]
FEIGPTSGVVRTVGRPFDRELVGAYRLVVEARSEAGGPHNAAHAVLDVGVLDVNDNAPIFVNLPYYSVVPVEAKAGDLVRKVEANDLDLGENGRVRYQLREGDSELFHVNAVSGEITLRQPLGTHNTEYTLVVAAVDNGIPSLETEAVVPIKVVNRAMPVFPRQFYSVSVPENLPPDVPVITVQADSPKGRQLIYRRCCLTTGSIVCCPFWAAARLRQQSVAVCNLVNFVHASDRDTGANARVQYSLEASALSTFHIDPVEGVIDLRVPLDHEAQPLYHLVVTATDAGSPSALSSTAHVWVTVLDMNDNPPAFPQLSYSCAVSELAPRGQFVMRVAASDPDSSDRDRLAYSIVGGNEAQAFAIDRKTGIVTLSNLHQFPQQPTYLLNVSVTDGVYLSHAKVKVAVLPSNRHSPAFTHTVYEAALPENRDAGFPVATVTATDKDRGHFGHVTYAIRSDDCAAHFRIDNATGEIFTTKPLDRESRHLYLIPVSATDGGGRLAFTMVRVTVTDVNDNEPQFAVSEYRVNIQVNTTVGTTILKAPSTTVGLSSNITSLFNVTHDSGEVYLRAPLEGKENNAYQFFVRVRDHGTPKPLENVVPVTVVVMHPGELGPRVDLATSHYFLRESDPVGTVVLTLNASQPHEHHGDPSSHQLTYSFVPAPAGSDHELDASTFSLDERGRMILVGELDRERQAEYYLAIRAETELSLVATVDVTVLVKDENDNAPVFDSASYRASVAENAEEGCAVAKLTAHDADRLQKITYEFYEGNDPAADIFRVDAITGTVTTLVALDREAVPSYNFTVSARDDGLPPRSATTWVFVEVVDVNDNAPAFARPRYDAAILEDAVPGTVIVTLETSDPDGVGAGLDLYVVSGDPEERFGVRSTGEVFVGRPLDREATASYFLEVVATDGVFVATTQLAIDVLDANDNPPVCLKSKYTELVSESIAVNTYILTVEATDADENRNAQLRYYLSGKGSDDFFINSTTGVLRTSRLLDRERQPRFRLTAHVQDWGQWDWECTSAVEILLSDVNDNAPAFGQDAYTAAVAEDVDVGTLVAKVHATDRDLGFNRRVSYSFVDSARGHFSIDETSGIVMLNRPLDREERATFNLTVQASDHGTPQLSSLATLLVVVQDVNDNPPEFSRKFYHAVVSEASAVGVEVLKVLATSRDSGLNAEVTYFFSAGNELGHFSIDAKTGSVKVAKPLDYEDVRDYFLTVLARDGGLPALSNQASVNVSVTDYNDCPPVFGLPVYNAVVREDARVGDRIIQASGTTSATIRGEVIASDADSAANAALQYAVVRGDRHGQFAIDKETGYISVAASLDREMISNYVLEVECTDGGTPPLSSKVLVNIEASDVNDNPPHFAQANYSAIVQEGKPVGFTVLKFTVSDPDSSPNGAPFALDIVSGNEDGAFRLVQTDSTLRTASKLDPKLRSEYELVVRASDSGAPPLSSECRVFVKAIEDSQFPPEASPMAVSVTSYLDDFPGGVLGRVRATDRDPYDQLAFELASSHQHLFSVDREDGTLIALPGLDVGTYSVNVSISDGKFTTYVGVSVEVVLDFLLTYKKGFLKGLRSLLNVRLKEIQVISIQPSAEEGSGSPPAQRSRRSVGQNLDVLFAVRKGAHGYYSAKFLKTRLKENLPLVEAASGLRIVQVAEDRCTSTHCVHGECLDHMALDRTFAVSVTTDQFSFVSPQHSRRLDCQCKPGFGGPKCEMAVNECSRKPCPPERLCVPDSSSLGYSCQCPEGKTGPGCTLVITCQDPDCYEEKHPMSFGGKSYAHYSLVAPMDRRLTLALMLRTVQATGNIVYSAGARDYSILEVVSGCVQYRFDCGSGEGVVRVEQVRVSDGAWHEVTLERRGNFARLSIDRRHEASGACARRARRAQPGRQRPLSRRGGAPRTRGAPLRRRPHGAGRLPGRRACRRRAAAAPRVGWRGGGPAAALRQRPVCLQDALQPGGLWQPTLPQRGLLRARRGAPGTRVCVQLPAPLRGPQLRAGHEPVRVGPMPQRRHLPQRAPGGLRVQLPGAAERPAVRLRAPLQPQPVPQRRRLRGGRPGPRVPLPGFPGAPLRARPGRVPARSLRIGGHLPQPAGQLPVCLPHQCH